MLEQHVACAPRVAETVEKRKRATVVARSPPRPRRRPSLHRPPRGGSAPHARARRPRRSGGRAGRRPPHSSSAVELLERLARRSRCRSRRAPRAALVYAASRTSPCRKRYSRVGRRRSSTTRSSRCSSESAGCSCSAATSRSSSGSAKLRPTTDATAATSRDVRRRADRAGPAALSWIAAGTAAPSAALDRRRARRLLEEERIAARPLGQRGGESPESSRPAAAAASSAPSLGIERLAARARGSDAR